MITTDEEALICDFAETYGIYDYRQLPLKTAAVLASGLRDNSRIKIKMSGLKASPETLMSAVTADRVGIIAWMLSEDGRHNRNRPESILASILEADKQNDVIAFENGQDFERARNEILGKEVI